eukprot:g5201.t1
MSDTLSASQHAAKNYGGAASDSSLSAAELRRRHGVRDNKKDWAQHAAPGVSSGGDDGNVMILGLVALILLIAVVAFFARG